MPSDVQRVTDSPQVFVQRANSFYLYSPGSEHVVPDHSEFERTALEYPDRQTGSGTKNTIRDPNNPAHLAEDLAHLHMRHPDHDKPILDPQSFINGYKTSDHPIEFVVRDSEGRLKQRIQSANVRTNNGGAWQAKAMFGDLPANYFLQGTATAASAAGSSTSNTGSNVFVSSSGSLTSAAITSVAADLYAGHVLVATNASNLVYGNILTHTSGTTPVFQVDRWHVLANSGTSPNTATDSAGTVPTNTTNYLIIPNMSPAFYMALSSDNTTNVSGTYPTAYSLTTNTQSQAQWATSELVFTTSGTDSGLGRRLATNQWQSAAPSGGTTTTVQGSWQLTYKWTAGAAGGTVARAGVFTSLIAASVTNGNTAGNILVFESTLLTTATLASNDTLAVTWTINF